MIRVFLDTNFVIDLFHRVEYKAIAQNLLVKGKLHGCVFYISYLTVANFMYICRKSPKEIILNQLKEILELFNIVSNDKNQISKAIRIKSDDFEDILQYCAAVSVNADTIITRNVKDFEFSDIPALTPMQFLDLFEK